MLKPRKVVKIIKGNYTSDGAGVKLKRVLGHGETELFDPFLMLDYFKSNNPDDYMEGFPWHPHRGIETVTYILSGCVEHGDSMGNSGTISDGECQYMTAGSGIIHQEMPKSSEFMNGIQLWVNLPSSLKMTEPKYNDCKKDNVPVIELESGSKVKIISGEFHGIPGPVTDAAMKPHILEIELKKGDVLKIPTPQENTAFIFPLDDGLKCQGSEEILNEGEAALLGEGDHVELSTDREMVRLLFFCGKPLKEPIVWSGPIVMNTDDEIRLAYKELRENTFIK